MNPAWRFLDPDRIDGVYSAALFESIGRHVGQGKVPETILFWRVSSPVVYLGYHQLVCEEINADFCSRNNVRIVRRILGGGCGFCDGDQILYSVIGKEDGIIPRDIQAAYRKVLGGVVDALRTLGAGGEIEPSRNAVYSKGRKISGNAQGRFEDAVLINGSLLLDFDFGLMDKVLKNPTKNLKPVDSSRDGMITLKEQGINDSETIIKALRQGFEKAIGISLLDGPLTESEVVLANRLLDKYEQKEWTYRMDIKCRLRKGDFL
ncbi:Lipoate-protein ligase A subunit 1 [uncultured archaeon]|nr:Lipoate-protein ligase A subunit 1 [uncultured archaeon]